MLFGLLPLLILAAVVAIIVRAVRSSGSEPRDSGVVMLRRFFQYATLYGVLMVVAFGVSGLLAQLIPGGAVVAAADSSNAARALAFVIVGVPVYLGIGAWVRRDLADGRERSSFGWSFYLTATLLTSLVIAGYGAFTTINWALGVTDLDRMDLSRGLVFAVVWIAHWFVVARYLSPPRGEGHVIAGSAITLLALASALGLGLFTVLDGLYADLFEVGIFEFASDDLRRAVSGLIVAGGLWWLYWVRTGVRLEPTPMWHVYVLLLGVLAGLSAAVGSATTMLYRVLEWLIGEPEAPTAARQFVETPALLATILVGVAALLYHRQVLADSGPRRRTEVRRIYEYAIAGLGLLGVGGAITVLLVALIQQLMPNSDVLVVESQRNVVIGAVTALVVSAPIWFGFWRRIQRARAAATSSEVRSKARRAYLGLLFGVGGVTALIALITAAFRIIEDLLEGIIGAATIRDVAPSLALVATTGVMAAYHWAVFREDRAEQPTAVKSSLREVILVGVAAPGTATRLADELDVRVRIWDRLDAQPAPLDVSQLVAELVEQSAERVMVLAMPGGHQVVPFAERR